MSRRNDLDLYERRSDRWWADGDRFWRSLRSVGEFHLGQVERRWGPRLDGARVADLGCGGGAMALALAERGAAITGIDRSPGSLRAARGEARRRGLDGRFLRADLLRTPLRSGAFDHVVMSDVLEHLEKPERAIREAARLLRPGGRLYVNTFDRSVGSSLAVVWLAEGLGLVPRGTHDPRLFVRPAELERYGRDAGLRLVDLVRERPLLARTALTRTVHLTESARGFGFSAFLEKEAP